MELYEALKRQIPHDKYQTEEEMVRNDNRNQRLIDTIVDHNNQINQIETNSIVVTVPRLYVSNRLEITSNDRPECDRVWRDKPRTSSHIGRTIGERQLQLSQSTTHGTSLQSTLNKRSNGRGI